MTLYMNSFICVSSGMVSIDGFSPSLWIVFFCFFKLPIGILWLDYFGAYCFWTVLLEKTLESPLDCKEIKPVNPKGNQSWIFTGRPDAEAETPILWLPDVKSQLIKKDPDAGKDWGQEEKGVTEDEMVEWHHWLNGQEFEQAPGDSEAQGSLICCSPWGCKQLDMTEWLNNNQLTYKYRCNTSIKSW